MDLGETELQQLEFAEFQSDDEQLVQSGLKKPRKKKKCSRFTKICVACCACCVGVIVLIVAYFAALRVKYPLPKIPTRWAAQVRTPDGANMNPMQMGWEMMAIDGTKGLMEWDSFAKIVTAPKSMQGKPWEWLNISFHARKEPAYWTIDINGETWVSPPGDPYAGEMAQYIDMLAFGWMAMALPDGEEDGYSKWSFVIPGVTTMSLLVDKDTPVKLAVGEGTPEQFVMEFKDFTTDHPLLTDVLDTYVYDGDHASYIPNAVCDEPVEKPVNLTMYLFHPADSFNISGQDLADAQGDTGFICADVIMGQKYFALVDHNYSWISQWTVEVFPRWGQYQQCNEYPPKCIGVNDFWVGRITGWYISEKKHGGQCDPTNEEVGQWFSLTLGGECKEGQKPNGVDCTWRKVKRVKTIDKNCLFEENRMAARCKADGRHPFPNATATLLAAFASDKVAIGGCPGVGKDPED